MHGVIGSTWAGTIALGRRAGSGSGRRTSARVMRCRHFTLIIQRAGPGEVRIARWLAWISDLAASVTRISPAVPGARIGTARAAARMEVGTVTGSVRIGGLGQVRPVFGPLLGRPGRVARGPGGQVVGRPGPLLGRRLGQVLRRPGLVVWRRPGQVVGWPGLLVWRRSGQVVGWPGLPVRRRLGQVGPGPLRRRPGQVVGWPGLLVRRRPGQVVTRAALVRGRRPGGVGHAELAERLEWVGEVVRGTAPAVRRLRLTRVPDRPRPWVLPLAQRLGLVLPGAVRAAWQPGRVLGRPGPRVRRVGEVVRGTAPAVRRLWLSRVPGGPGPGPAIQRIGQVIGRPVAVFPLVGPVSGKSAGAGCISWPDIGPMARTCAVASPGTSANAWPGAPASHPGCCPPGPRCSVSTILGRSAMASRKVPVHIPPCQMLRTATPVSAYQLSRMLRELPRTSKKTSPRRGSGAASDADMVPMVTPNHRLCLPRWPLAMPRPGRQRHSALASFPIQPA